MFKKSLILLAMLSFSACGSLTPKQELGVKGGVAGAGIGAGTGAIVGAAIANGDIAASALLGAGIGLPVGIAAGMMYADYLEKKEVQEGNSVIEDKRTTILSNEEAIHKLRLETDLESRTINVDPSDSEFIYNGHTLGNPYRR